MFKPLSESTTCSSDYTQDLCICWSCPFLSIYVLYAPAPEGEAESLVSPIHALRQPPLTNLLLRHSVMLLVRTTLLSLRLDLVSLATCSSESARYVVNPIENSSSRSDSLRLFLGLVSTFVFLRNCSLYPSRMENGLCSYSCLDAIFCLELTDPREFPLLNSPGSSIFRKPRVSIDLT